MSNKFTLEESLSALMDNEIDDLELRRVLKALPEEEGLQSTWSRYHLISATMKQEAHSRTSVDILSAVRLQIENEPVPSYGSATSNSVTNANVFRRIGQGAIAASVAVVILYTANFTTKTNSSVNNVDFVENTNQVSPVEEPLIFNGNYTVSEFSRFASFEESPEDRIRQAVYQEFEETQDSSDSAEILVELKAVQPQP